MEAGNINGQQYFVPMDWGFIAPLVNVDHVDPSEETFGVLFDERYKGKIAWVDTLNMMVIAGYYLEVAEPLGHDRRGARRGPRLPDLQEGARPLLLEPVLRLLVAFQKEEVWAGYSWPDTVGYADAEGMNYAYMQPKEGRISWVCGFGLFADTENYHHAHEYVNSWASTEAAEFLLGYYYYGHTNTEADLSVVPDGVGTPRSGRSDGAPGAEFPPGVADPTARRVPAVLERGAGGLTARPVTGPPPDAGNDVATLEATAAGRGWRRRDRRVTAGLLAGPMLWLLIFFVIPVLFVAAYSVGAV